MKETAELKVSAKWKLVKWEGDPPAPGARAEPLEILEGGDGLETKVVYHKGQMPTLLIEALPCQ